jgi:hypothetical protein
LELLALKFGGKNLLGIVRKAVIIRFAARVGLNFSLLLWRLRWGWGVWKECFRGVAWLYM